MVFLKKSKLISSVFHTRLLASRPGKIHNIVHRSFSNPFPPPHLFVCMQKWIFIEQSSFQSLTSCLHRFPPPDVKTCSHLSAYIWGNSCGCAWSMYTRLNNRPAFVCASLLQKQTEWKLQIQTESVPYCWSNFKTKIGQLRSIIRWIIGHHHENSAANVMQEFCISRR